MMKITFDTNNKEEVAEVLALIAPESNTADRKEPKEEKTTPSIPKEEKAAEKPKKAPVKKAGKTTLADLKELAKNKVAVSGRDKVKAIIAEFAEKLAEVAEKDYAELAEKLAI